jgi:hypothetical protein
VMDIVPDRDAGRRTTAVILGVRPSKFIVATVLLIESALVLHYFKNIIIGASLAAMAAWFLLDALVLWRDRHYTTPQMRFFLIGWNVIALASMVWIWRTAALSVIR